MRYSSWRFRTFLVAHMLGFFSAGLLVGLWAGRWSDLNLTAEAVFIILVLLLGSLRSRRWWSLVIIFGIGLSLGAVRASAVEQEYSQYESLVGASLTITGELSGDPQKVGDSKQRLTIAKVQLDEISYPGEVFVTLRSSTKLKRGDVVTLRGEAREGFASYGLSLTATEIVSIERPANMIRDIRENFAESVRSVVVDPMASLGLGFVIGQRSTLPDELDEQLKIVGLTHIVVASGYNLTILVRFIMRVISRHSRYLALIGSLVAVLLFVLFSGFSPSMNRAVLVTVLGLLAWYVGRRFHPLLLILYVASATALYNPMYIWNDLGWYLSFFAFTGILIIAPLVIGFLYRNRKPTPFEQLVLETLSAEIMVLPLIAASFSLVPVFGLLSNVLVAPFIPVAMALTATTGVLGLLSEQVALLAALPTSVLIGYMISVVEWLASFPMAQHEAKLGSAGLVAWYAAVGVITYVIYRKQDYDFSSRDRRLDP